MNDVDTCNIIPFSHDSVNTLPNTRSLVIDSTMQCLCLDNDEREETVNGYFANTANGSVIQPSISFEPPKYGDG